MGKGKWVKRIRCLVMDRREVCGEPSRSGTDKGWLLLAENRTFYT